MTFGRYVELYDSEPKLGVALLLGILGEEGFQQFNTELKNASPEEQQELIDEITDAGHWEEFAESIQIPDTPEGWKAARKHFESLPPEEQQALSKKGAFLCSFFFGSFFNILSLMVHGEKLTALVPQAIAGDDSAFMRAIQTDRMLLLHHPYFMERKLRAQNEGDKKFLLRLASREASPILNGKIQYPGLYMLFGLLESFQWLDDLKAKEILDICNDAGLDRQQNRINDVNYLSTRLREYRKWQKTIRLSRI